MIKCLANAISKATIYKVKGPYLNSGLFFSRALSGLSFKRYDALARPLS